MIGAHAQQYYGMDQDTILSNQKYGTDNGMNSYDKKPYGKDNSYDTSKDSSNVKCNNINVNVNGFNGIQVGALPPALSALATDEAQAADEGEVGASTLGNGGGSDGGRPSGYDNDSRFVCINSNDINVAANELTPEPPDTITCEECFTKMKILPHGQFKRLNTALVER